jgi:hypothetical protein
MRPLLSAFCDGEAKPEQVAELREHLRACTRCRATLRAYRAAPAAAAGLAPFVPPHASLWERARDAVGDLLGRFGGDAASPAAAGTGIGGTAAGVKIAAACVAAAGGAAACVAGGFAPNPIDLGGERDRPAVERQISETATPESPQPHVEDAPEPTPEPRPKATPRPEPSPAPASEEEEPVAEPVPVESEAVEYAPPPAEPAAEPVAEPSGGGSPAGEFGP